MNKCLLLVPVFPGNDGVLIPGNPGIKTAGNPGRPGNRSPGMKTWCNVQIFYSNWEVKKIASKWQLFVTAVQQVNIQSYLPPTASVGSLNSPYNVVVKSGEWPRRSTTNSTRNDADVVTNFSYATSQLESCCSTDCRCCVWMLHQRCRRLDVS